MRNKTFHLLTVLAISAALLTACAPETVEVVKTVEVPKEVEVVKTVEVEVEKEAEGPLTFVLIPKSVGHPFWGDLEKGMHAQAVELGVQAIFHGPELALAEGQIDLFETYLNMGVDAIGMAPNDPATVPPLVESAEEAGVFFLTFDTDAPES
jgi:ABC-type sugar transport system substrate-binding protein